MRLWLTAFCLAISALPVSAETAPARAARSRLPAFAASHSSSDQCTLPVRKVVLYKNGVGYFEHAGTVTGNQRVAIDFTSPQLNDVLQSLTVLDEGGGRICRSQLQLHHAAR